MATGSAERTRRGSRLVGIEGLRAIAATSILVYHVWLYGAPDAASVELGLATKLFDNLRAGVTLFFALSGFLLFRPYVAAAIRRRPTPSLRSYLRNRALRILPAYWVILLVVVLVVERELLSSPKQVAANAFFLQNYAPEYMLTGIVPAWSLAIEVVFYIAVPILGGLAIRLAARGARPSSWAPFVPVVAMLCVGIASKLAIRTFDLDRVWQLSFLAHADWFAAGMAVAVARVYWEDGQLRLGRYWRPVTAGLAALLSLGAVALYSSGTLTALEYQTPIAAACGLLLALVVFAEPGSRLLALLTWRPIAAAGVASYSVFLWHDPLVRFLRDLGLTLDGTAGLLVNIGVVSALTALLAAATYRFVEQPALSRKRSWQQGSPAGREPAAEPANATGPAASPAAAPSR